MPRRATGRRSVTGHGLGLRHVGRELRISPVRFSQSKSIDVEQQGYESGTSFWGCCTRLISSSARLSAMTEDSIKSASAPCARWSFSAAAKSSRAAWRFPAVKLHLSKVLPEHYFAARTGVVNEQRLVSMDCFGELVTVPQVRPSSVW
jgi:hypothetical protein